MQNMSFTGLPKKERKEHQIESRGMDFHTTSSAHVMCDFGQIIWSSVAQFTYLCTWNFTICLLSSTEMLQEQIA